MHKRTCTNCKNNETLLLKHSKWKVVAWQSQPVYEEYYTVYCSSCYHESDQITTEKEKTT